MRTQQSTFCKDSKLVPSLLPPMPAPMLESGNVCMSKMEFRQKTMWWLGSGSRGFGAQSTVVLELLFKLSTCSWIEMNHLAATCTELAAAVHGSQHMHVCWLQYENNYWEGLRVVQEEEHFEHWYRNFIVEYEGDLPLALSDDD